MLPVKPSQRARLMREIPTDRHPRRSLVRILERGARARGPRRDRLLFAELAGMAGSAPARPVAGGRHGGTVPPTLRTAIPLTMAVWGFVLRRCANWCWFAAWRSRRPRQLPPPPQPDEAEKLLERTAAAGRVEGGSCTQSRMPPKPAAGNAASTPRSPRSAAVEQVRVLSPDPVLRPARSMHVPRRNPRPAPRPGRRRQADRRRRRRHRHLAPSAPRRAASTSSSSTTPAASAWPAAASLAGHDALRRRQPDRHGHGPRGAAGRREHAGAGRRLRHRPVPHHEAVPARRAGRRASAACRTSPPSA